MRVGIVRVLVVTALAAAGMVAVAAPAPAGSTAPDAVFDAVGSHTFVVPADVCAITVHARGAQGGNAGGLGGSAIYTFGVTPLDTLQVNVGGQGADSAGMSGGVGGFNGGGSGGATGSGTGGGGGGASDIRRGDLGLGDRVVVAGGGGGGGGAAVNGGSGGGLDGFSGGGSFPGEGGMQEDPGAGGDGASPGIFGVGGAGVSAGGGGGGGWFGGGGGGAVSGGGGGSGFTPDGSGMANGLRDADGLVEISFVPGFCEPGPPEPDAAFDSVGSHEFEVPADVCAIEVEAFGAQGASTRGGLVLGGLGGAATAIIPVTPTETLEVNVGGEGTTITGGFNGGGTGGTGSLLDGGGGGGASDVRQGGDALSNRVVVAGGGGGAGAPGDAPGGTGGGTTGGPGSGPDTGFGTGATQSGPGVAGGNGTAGDAGGLIGGNGGTGELGGGGGGGGLFGGGGGGGTSGSAFWGGGGGGSGFTPDGTGMANGVNDGDGEVAFSFVPDACDEGVFQPDATRETPRLGNDVYDNGSFAFQTQFESVRPRFGSTLDVYVQNDGDTTDDILLTGLGSSPGFLVRYQQLVAPDGSKPKNYITEQVVGGGFLLENLAAGGEAKVRIQVKVSVNAPIGSQVNLPLKATSVGDGSKADTARLVVTVVAP